MRLKSLAVIVLIACSAHAHAGPFGDDLARCLVDSTSRQDRELLVRWIFAAMAAHPAVTSIANVPPAALDEVNANTAALVLRLISDTCSDTAKKTISYEGEAAFQASFQVLGQVAAGEIFADPDVQKAMAALGKAIERRRLEDKQQ